VTIRSGVGDGISVIDKRSRGTYKRKVKRDEGVGVEDALELEGRLQSLDVRRWGVL
jgi:hypothetical protein